LINSILSLTARGDAAVWRLRSKNTVHLEGRLA
jgi:hypothetical protein